MSLWIQSVWVVVTGKTAYKYYRVRMGFLVDLSPTYTLKDSKDCAATFVIVLRFCVVLLVALNHVHFWQHWELGTRVCLCADLVTEGYLLRHFVFAALYHARLPYNYIVSVLVHPDSVRATHTALQGRGLSATAAWGAWSLTDVRGVRFQLLVIIPKAVFCLCGCLQNSLFR